MKRFLTVLLCLITAMTLTSCRGERVAHELLSDFVSAYGAEGIIYTPTAKEGEDGHVTSELLDKIFVYEGEFPENFALFLNSHVDYASECGVFVCESVEERSRVEEMCAERIRLIARGSDKSFISRSGLTVFYSTMTDRVAAEKIWGQILKR